MQNRRDAFLRRGGDLLQMEKPIPYLRDLEVDVTVSLDSRPSVDRFDVVHLHNITRILETHQQCLNAAQRRKPIVVSPIYNSQKDYISYLCQSSLLQGKVYRMIASYEFYQRVRTVYYGARGSQIRSALEILFSGYKNAQANVLRLACALTPQSPLETMTVEEEIGIRGLQTVVVPLGVEIEPEIVSVSPTAFRKRYGIKDFVLVVGRVEPIKNQLALLEALWDEDVPIVVVGEIQEHHRKYARIFRRFLEAKKTIFWIRSLDRRMLFSAMMNAHVVALPSWFETCGLSGLEGGLVDANIVVTQRGYTQWYYEDDAWYCDPADPPSIRTAVIEALNARRGSRSFAERIRKEFTWYRAAKALKRVYELSLESSKC